MTPGRWCELCFLAVIAETLNRRWWGVRRQQADAQQANMAFFPQEVGPWI